MTEDKPPVGVGVAGKAEDKVVEVDKVVDGEDKVVEDEVVEAEDEVVEAEDEVVEAEDEVVDGNEMTPVGAGPMDIVMV